MPKIRVSCRSTKIEKTSKFILLERSKTNDRLKHTVRGFMRLQYHKSLKTPKCTNILVYR